MCKSYSKFLLTSFRLVYPDSEVVGVTSITAEGDEDTGEIAVSGHKRRKKRTLEELCASLPVEEHIVNLPETEQVNHNGTPLVCIGREYIRTELVM